jgi:hypothetical protein
MELIYVPQMVVMSSLAAAVQGMDEAVINGAQILYPKQFGIGSDSSKHPSFIFADAAVLIVSPSERDGWLIGVVNSAPYL